MAIWDPRKEKLHTLVLLGLEEVRRHPTSYFLSSFCWGNTWFWFWVLLVGSLTPLLRQLTSLPSHPQFWLCLVWQSVCVCQSVSVLSFSYLIVALCFIFGESGQGSSARHSALDLVLTCLRISRKKKRLNWEQNLTNRHRPWSTALLARSPAQPLRICFWFGPKYMPLLWSVCLGYRLLA